MATVYTIKRLGRRGRPKRFWDFWDAIRYANRQNRKGIPVIMDRIGPPAMYFPQKKGEKND